MPKDRRLVWALAARADLHAIWRYYAETLSLDSAERMVRDIHEAAGRLDRLDVPGRARDELLPGLRSVLARPYIVFFRQGGDGLEIVRILHERRDISKVLKRE